MPVLGPNIALGAHARGKGGGVPAPAIVLSATSIAEDAEIGSVVATLSVSNLPDGVTVTGYTLTADPDDVLDISDDDLITTAALDYETATSHAYTIEAALSEGGPVTRSGVIAVTNVFEEPDLVALTLDADEIVSGSEEGTVVGDVVGQTSGSTLSLVDDAGGRLKLSGGQILAGATATDYDTATSHNITLRETLADSSNSPRDSVIAISVAAGGPTWAEWIVGLTETQVLDIDFGETDRHFQDVTGATLADDAGENIALAFDSALWGGSSLSAVLSAATQRVTNGDFTADTSGWATSGSSALSSVGGKLSVVPADNLTRIAYQQVTTVAGGYHYLDFDYDQSTAVTPRYYSGTGLGFGDIIGLSTLTGAGSIHRGFAAPGTSAYLHLGAVSSGGLTVLYDNVSLKRVPGNRGIQTTSNLQGKRQTGGVCRYDGSDDNHLTNFLAQNGAMTVYTRAIIPASLAAVQVLMGASGAGANRIWVGVDTSGRVCAGVGSDSNSAIFGAKDVRGKEIDVAVSIDGTTVKILLKVDGVVTEEYSGPQASTPTTTIPFRLGANNNNGTAGSFSGIDAKRMRAAHKAMTLAEFTSISAEA